MKWTPGDKILIAALAVLNIFLFTQTDFKKEKGSWVVIEVDQKVVKRAPLSMNQIIPVKGKLGVTEVEVRDGRAHIRRSPCLNKVCIKSGYIQYTDRLAACIPNRVVVKIQGTSHNGVDAILG